MQNPVYPSLQDQLDEITANTRALVPADRLARLEQVIDELRGSRIEEQLPGIGTFAPDFSLTASSGKRVALKDLLSLGSVLVKFFRGRWDAYDMTELETWQGLLPTLRQRRTLLVAISPQTPRQNAFTSDRHHLTFPLLSDPGCAVAAQYSLAYTVPEPTRTYYRSILVNVPFLNGDESWQLPVPATFALDRDGRIRFAQGFADHRLRPDPTSVLAALVGTGNAEA